MSRLGYIPNRAARSLRGGSFLSIGVVVKQLERTGETMVTAGIVDAAEEYGYTVALVQVSHPESNTISGAMRRLSNAAVDGLIIVQAGHASSETIALPVGLPVVVSDTKLTDSYAAVTADQIQGSRLAVEHLIGLGHKTIHHVTGPPDSVSGLARTGAWRRTLMEHGIDAPEPITGDWSADSGYAAGLRLANQDGVTAVYCSNDEMSFGLIRALTEQGISVPEDVSVVGFDDIGVSKYFLPPLTTVRQDFRRIGRELVEKLITLMSETGNGNRGHDLVPCELIVRGSTAPPRRR